MARFGFLINLELCSDMRNCMTACKREKDTELGVRYMRTYTSMDDGYPKNTTYFLPFMCQHCENPSCVGACPYGVFAKVEGGVVAVGDTAACEKCQDKPCVAACPYGAISIDSKGQAGKCDMCLELLAQGQPPACVPNCHCMSIAFGDMDDPESPYSQALAMARAVAEAAGAPPDAFLHQLKPETGNNPAVTYVLAKKPWRDMNGLCDPAWVDKD